MKKIILIFLAMLGFNACVNAQDSRYADMDVKQFADYITGENVQLVDVRTPEEYAAGHIQDAENIDFYSKQFAEMALKTLDKSKPVAVYCRSGKRSAEAAGILGAQGYKVTNLKGGIMAWTAQKEPIVK